MNYADTWGQYSEEYQDEVLWHCWCIYGAWGPMGQARADFENMLLMGGEMG